MVKYFGEQESTYHGDETGSGKVTSNKYGFVGDDQAFGKGATGGSTMSKSAAGVLEGFARETPNEGKGIGFRARDCSGMGLVSQPNEWIGKKATMEGHAAKGGNVKTTLNPDNTSIFMEQSGMPVV